ncbi:hypothetical protein WJX77_007266 [Trebouxia sp. C0004]
MVFKPGRTQLQDRGHCSASNPAKTMLEQPYLSTRPHCGAKNQKGKHCYLSWNHDKRHFRDAAVTLGHDATQSFAGKVYKLRSRSFPYLADPLSMSSVLLSRQRLQSSVLLGLLFLIGTHTASAQLYPVTAPYFYSATQSAQTCQEVCTYGGVTNMTNYFFTGFYNPQPTSLCGLDIDGRQWL